MLELRLTPNSAVARATHRPDGASLIGAFAKSSGADQLADLRKAVNTGPFPRMQSVPGRSVGNHPTHSAVKGNERHHPPSSRVGQKEEVA